MGIALTVVSKRNMKWIFLLLISTFIMRISQTCSSLFFKAADLTYQDENQREIE